MTESAKLLIPVLNSLAAEDRAELASFLIDSLEDRKAPDADERAWIDELDRRAKSIRDGTALGRPASEISELLRRKHS